MIFCSCKTDLLEGGHCVREITHVIWKWTLGALQVWFRIASFILLGLEDLPWRTSQGWLATGKGALAGTVREVARPFSNIFKASLIYAELSPKVWRVKDCEAKRQPYNQLFPPCTSISTADCQTSKRRLTSWVWIPAPPLISCVMWGKLFNLLEPVSSLVKCW